MVTRSSVTRDPRMHPCDGQIAAVGFLSRRALYSPHPRLFIDVHRCIYFLSIALAFDSTGHPTLKPRNNVQWTDACEILRFPLGSLWREQINAHVDSTIYFTEKTQGLSNYEKSYFALESISGIKRSRVPDPLTAEVDHPLSG